jgi:hypothetical protein
MLGQPRQSLIRQLLRREDGSIWLTGAVSVGVLNGRFPATLSGIWHVALNFGLGIAVGMVVTSAFRGAALFQHIRDLQAIARQQQEIRNETSLRQDRRI